MARVGRHGSLRRPRRHHRHLPLQAVASAHGPILRGDRIADAFARTQALAAQPALPTPGQDMLDELLAAFAPAAA